MIIDFTNLHNIIFVYLSGECAILYLNTGTLRLSHEKQTVKIGA